MAKMTVRPIVRTIPSEIKTCADTVAGEKASTSVPPINTSPLIKHTRQ